MVAMAPKERLHQLVEQLPEEELYAAQRYLTYLQEQGDPLLRRLMLAPPDDEPETEGERQAVTEAYEDLHADRVHSLGEVKRDLDQQRSSPSSISSSECHLTSRP